MAAQKRARATVDLRGDVVRKINITGAAAFVHNTQDWATVYMSKIVITRLLRGPSGCKCVCVHEQVVLGHQSIMTAKGVLFVLTLVSNFRPAACDDRCVTLICLISPRANSHSSHAGDTDD